MPAPSDDYDADGGPALPGTQPIIVSQPTGPSFKISDGEVSWQQWHFRFRLDPRVGPIVNLVSLEDRGKRRSVLYEGSISELYVPYMDPEETWNSQVFLDTGEYFMSDGVGTLKPLQAVLIVRPMPLFSALPFTTPTDAPSSAPRWLVSLNAPMAILRGVMAIRSVFQVAPPVNWFCGPWP
jgi:primary-amine oxidase